MGLLELDNPEESKISWFTCIPKNRVNSENWKLVCEHLNNLEISKEDTMYLPLIAISQILVSNGCQSGFGWRCRSVFLGLWGGAVHSKGGL